MSIKRPLRGTVTIIKIAFCSLRVFLLLLDQSISDVLEVSELKSENEDIRIANRWFFFHFHFQFMFQEISQTIFYQFFLLSFIFLARSLMYDPIKLSDAAQ